MEPTDERPADADNPIRTDKAEIRACRHPLIRPSRNQVRHIVCLRRTDGR